VWTPAARPCAPARLRNALHDLRSVLRERFAEWPAGRRAAVEESSDDVFPPLTIRPVRFGAWVRAHSISIARQHM